MTDVKDGMLFDGLPSDPTARRPRPRRPRRPAEPVRHWPLDGAINVVLFAGMGGACQGLEDAGLPVHVACNHDEVAIAAHKALNPHARHITGDLFDVDPIQATGGRLVKLLWASPDCKDHSSAKGGAPRSPRVRSLPWQVCRWAGKVRPELIMMENVREIRGWGPLIAKRVKVITKPERDGKPAIWEWRVVKLDGTIAKKGERVPVQQQQLVRDKRRLGRTFRRWRRHLEGLGYVYEDRDLCYVYEDRDLCCADYGVPTSRRRWFAIARRDGRPIAWPERTHAPKDHPDVPAGRLKPWRAAAEIIDWSLPLPSIFDRKKPLAPATRKRIATGVKRFVLQSATPFLVHLTHHKDRAVHDTASDPVPTITTAHRGEMSVVVPSVVPVCHSRDGGRVHDGADPLVTQTTAKGGELAVAGAVLAPTIVRPGHTGPGYTAHRGQDAAAPLQTVTGSPEFGVAAATLAPAITGAGGRAGQSPPMDAADPLNTSTTKEDRCVVAAHLTRYHGERRPDEARGIDPAEPVATFTTENRFGVIGAFLEEHRSGSVGQPAGDPLTTQTATEHSAVIGAAMVQTGYGERDGQAPRALDVGQPVGTQVAGGAKHGVVGAFMVQHNTGVVGHSPDDPLSTMTTVGTQQQVAAAYLTEFRGTSQDGQPVTEPAPTLCTGGGRGGGHSGVTAAFLTEYYGTGGQHQECGAPLNTLTTTDRFAVTACALSDDPARLARARQVAEFLRELGAWTGGDLVTVTIGDTTWIVVDIGMRMLTPREAAAAHELRMPDAITVAKRDRKGNVVIGPDGEPVMETRPLTKTEAMRLVGNSVPKRMAMLLARANAVHALTHPSIAAPSIAAE